MLVKLMIIALLSLEGSIDIDSGRKETYTNAWFWLLAISMHQRAHELLNEMHQRSMPESLGI